jgi:hypothetical protein
VEYVFLIVANDATAAATDEQMREQWEAHDVYARKLTEAGVVRGGKPLQPDATATTVRSDDGADRLITDGPYAETKEYIAGYYEVEVADLDEALHWARQLPLLPGGAVEVRPVMPVP